MNWDDVGMKLEGRWWLNPTWRKHGRSRKNGLWCRRFWGGLCNRIEQHSPCCISHRPTACDYCAFFWSASWFQPDHPVRGRGHGASSWAPGTQTPASSPPASPSSAASMAPYGVAGASEGSGLSETPGCRSHKCIDPIPIEFWAKETPPPRLDL